MNWKLIVPALGVIALIAGWWFLPVKEWLEAFTGWIEQRGVWGYVLFAAFYALATLLLFPGALLTLASGFAFGFATGLAVVVIGAAAGAALAFLAARYLLRSAIEPHVKKRRKLAALDKAVEEEGWKAVMLVRLSPLVPFNLQNYLFGLTRVGFWPYFGATLVGIFPGASLYAYVGAAGGALTGGSQWGAPQWAFFAFGLAATAAVTVILSRAAKRKLAEDSRGAG